MAVICFGSLKGGVGKTSLSVNVAHAFAERGCETLLIDLDPMGHASRFFRQHVEQDQEESPLARLFLGSDRSLNGERGALNGPSSGISTRSVSGIGAGSASAGSGAVGSDDNVNLVERAVAEAIPLVVPVRNRLALLRSGPELRYFLWGRGARAFKQFFQQLIEELHSSFDYIVIDTPPDFNVLTRNALATSELVVVPVDSSAMSIHCLEEIITSAGHIKGPRWAIVRSMVTKQASRMQRLTSARLQETFQVTSPQQAARAREDLCEDEDDEDIDISNPESFIELVERRERGLTAGGGDRPAGRLSDECASAESDGRDQPILLLNSVVYRSEQQNRMTFLGATAFDSKGDKALREQYGGIAREVDFILSIGADDDPLLDVQPEFSLSAGLQ